MDTHTPPQPSRESRHDFFVRRVKELGLHDDDADYGGLIGRTVERMSTAFNAEGQSGGSAYVSRQVFMMLMLEWDHEAAAHDLAIEPSDTDLLRTIDAQVWAETFLRYVHKTPTIATDLGTMLAWFSAATMRGWDEHARRLRARIEHLITHTDTAEGSIVDDPGPLPVIVTANELRALVG